jgi:hypothetical protein
LIAAACALVLVVGYLTWNASRDKGNAEGGLANLSSNIGTDALLFGRPDFRICVDRVGAEGLEPTTGDLEEVTQAVRQALAAAPYVPAEYQTPIVELECPKSEALSNGPLDYYERNSSRDEVPVIGKAPDAPSPHRAFVYLTDPARFAEVFGEGPYATASEEYGCQGGLCLPVTHGVYVPIGSPIRPISDGLRAALGLLTEEEVRDQAQRQAQPPRTPSRD